MSDSVRPHRRQPTRLLRPWNFPGKNTGVGCQCLLHFSLLAMNIPKMKFIKWVVTVSSKRKKCLEINLTKEVQVLYTENHRTSLKQIYEDQNQRKDIPCSWPEGLTVVQRAVLPKLLCGLSTFLRKPSLPFWRSLQACPKSIFVWVLHRTNRVRISV